MPTELPVNSSAYWEWRFEGDWAEASGCEQTRYFARILLDNLPGWLDEEIRENNLAICDWGCAEGEAVDSIRAHFPQSRVIGIDRSSNAIRTAKQKFGSEFFIHTDVLSSPITSTFDIVTTSNVLEHFKDPWPALARIGALAGRHLVVLVPFCEEHRIPEHHYVFDRTTISTHVEPDFTLSAWEVIDCRKHPIRMWPESQVMLVYSRSRYFPSYNAIRAADQQQGDLEHLTIALLGRLSDRFREEAVLMATRVGQLSEGLGSAKVQIELLNKQLVNTRAERDLLTSEVHRRTTRVTEVEKELEDRTKSEKQVSSDSQRLREEVDRLRHEHSSLIAENQQLASRARVSGSEAARLGDMVCELQRSLSWKVTAPLRRVAKPLFAAIQGKRLRQQTVSLAPAMTPPRPSPRQATDTAELGQSQHTSPMEGIRSGLRTARSIAIVPCAVPFSAGSNQRPISCAKYLASQGYTVLFVAWQWSPNDEIPGAYEQVAPGIYHIPLYAFLEETNTILSVPKPASVYLCTLPSSTLVRIARPLREAGYHIHYDIMDDWEEFGREGQAPWYSWSAEREMVQLCDTVSAVSERLTQKFGDLRSDIALIPNGYDPVALQCEPFVAARTRSTGLKSVGYFGHLTDAWFDWDVLMYAAKRLKEVHFQLIGTGVSRQTLVRLGDFPNIHLLGPVPQSDLHYSAMGWSAAIIPFRPSRLSSAVDPLKVYEYLYFGLPVISTGIPGIASYPWVRSADNRESFVSALEDVALHGTQPGDQTLVEVAGFLTTCVWEQRLARLMTLINSGIGLRSFYAIN